MISKNALLTGLLLLLASGLVAQLGQDVIVSKKYTYPTLSPYQKQLFDDFIEDEIPTGSNVTDALTDHTSLRSKTRLAEALLFRNKAGDKEKAAFVLRWILQNQHRDPNTKIYGIWRTSVANDKFDQNWREFIGCELIIIRHHFKALLPDDILKEIEIALVHAAKGALNRNVAAEYTNISMMSAFLMEYVGNEFKIDALKQAGLKKAKDVFALFQQHHTFSEYNSPTYYGVTLIGLALWRELAFSSEIRNMGKTLETAFWHEITTFYNPNLKNMVGPYFRGYGMDMQKYFAITGICIAVAVDDAKWSPIPPKNGPKYGEMSNIAPIFSLGLSIPEVDLAKLKKFSKPQFVSRIIPNTYKGDSLKRVTAMMQKDWMMGGLWGNRRVWGQIKTGTIHWKVTDGEVGWLMVPGDGKTNVQVNQKTMKVFLADSAARNIVFYVCAPNAVTTSLTDNLWALPNMNLGINTALKRTVTENVESAVFQKQWEVSEQNATILKVVYEVPAAWDVQKPLIEITPKK